MTKLAAVRRTPRPRGTPRRPEMASLVEGQITELCRDIAIEVKRMRQLQTQTSELRLALEEWIGYAEPRGCNDIGYHPTEFELNLPSQGQTPRARRRSGAYDAVTTASVATQENASIPTMSRVPARRR